MGANDPPPGFGAWYGQKQGDTGDLWHRTLIDPGLFSRLGELPPATRVLDLGCGNGYIARALARSGASVVGVDSSRELIEAARAREATEPLGITYVVAEAADLATISTASIDVAVANMSLMDISDGAGAIREVGRVVRPGGRFVASISHPCFDVDTRSGWTIEITTEGTRVYRKVTGYRTPHSDTYPWDLGDGRTVRTVGYHRPLSWYATTLRESGFVLVALDEPAPGPGFMGRRVQREWIAEIPLHLVFEARRESAGPGPSPRPSTGPALPRLNRDGERPGQ